MAIDILARLSSALDEFDGIVGGIGRPGSYAHEDGHRVVVALVTEDNVQGHVAALTVDKILSRLGTGARLDGRAPVSADAALDCGCGTAGATFYGLSKQQAEVFNRVLRYAMDMGFDPQIGRSSIRGVAVEPVSGTPLFVLLSRAFETYRGCFERASADYGDSPSLGVWSNVLRPFDAGVFDQRELIRRGVLSRRAVRALVRDLERLGWLEEERPARGQTSLRLTDAGLRAQEAGRILVDEAEQGFVDRFGAQATSALRETLVGIAGQLEVELPWHLTGYGVADSSLTGGQHVPAQPGPPRTPAHGADWPVVLRNPAADVSVQPLSALLSKALAAFRIDYEWDMRGHGTGLDFIANFLRFVDDDGVDLKTASTMGSVTGNGRSALERHFVVVVEPRQGRGASRRVYLTPKGKQARDTYPFLVAKVEREWQGRYGACVDDLRGVLESLDRDFDAGLPGYPSTTDWLYRSMLAGSAAARVTKKRTDMNEGRNPGGIP